jgi:hypothetical protein
MVGLEKLVEAIFNSHQGLNPPVRNTAPHLIIDARPLTNAIAQTAMGAGTENESNYPGSKLVFLGIENIHVVRDSFNKLYDGTDFSFNLACVSFEGGIFICGEGWSRKVLLHSHLHFYDQFLCMLLGLQSAANTRRRDRIKSSFSFLQPFQMLLRKTKFLLALGKT